MQTLNRFANWWESLPESRRDALLFKAGALIAVLDVVIWLVASMTIN